MDGVKSHKSIIETKIGVPLVFKLLTTVLICAMLIPGVPGGGDGIGLFVYPFDLLFSIVVVSFNHFEKPLNIITLLFILLIPLITMAMLLIPSLYYLVESTPYLFNIMKNDGVGFWGGLVTIALISFDILRFNRCGGSENAL